jgi:hypothetical protein
VISAPRFALAAACALFLAHAAAAQPTLMVSTNSSANIVIPGKPVTLTLSEPGAAGKQYAFIASAYGAGFSHAGTPLAVGPDVVVLAIGTLPGAATATLEYTPPFLGSTLDRYYVQAVTSFTSAFSPLLASNGVVLRNGDLVPQTTMGSNTGTIGRSIVVGTNYLMATPSFVAERDQTCLVTTSLQFNPVVVVGNGLVAALLRNAVTRNGAADDDGVYGQLLVGAGTNTYLAPITRASVIPIGAGQTIRFGAYFESAFAGSATVQTAYICS